jgi:hypothetical protein
MIKNPLCTWWSQHTSFLPHYLAQSDCLAADRQSQGDTRLTLTPSVIPNYNYVIMVSDWNCLKYFCVFFILQSSCIQRRFDRPVLLAVGKQTNIQRSLVKRCSGLSHGVNRRAPSAVYNVYECAVQEPLKLQTSKIADTSCSHSGFLSAFLLRRFNLLATKFYFAHPVYKMQKYRTKKR